MAFKRVSRKTPCPICGKPDWCLVAENNSAAICSRVQEGSVKKCGDAGWLHILVDLPKNRQYRSQRRLTVKLCNDRPDRDFAALQQQYSRQITSQQINALSQQLGVSAQSLKRLNIGWDGKAYTFPMSNGFGKLIGIRRRFTDGCKVSVKGSKAGLFIPTGLTGNKRLLICEGATDTAAALDLGFDAIGRPNCNSRIEMTAQAARGRAEIVIVGDNDKAGRAGAKKLADALALHYSSVKVISPPEGIKDLRQWLNAGLSLNFLNQTIQQSQREEVKITFRKSRKK
jgi:hypothetical protein